MSIPTEIREEMKKILWRHADELQWHALGPAEKSKYYTVWTESEAIGRRLSAFMDPRSVRVYIKDTLLKGYGREKLNEYQEQIFRIVGRSEANIRESFIKPHGFRFSDQSIVAWGRADDWKVILGSIFERMEGHMNNDVVVVFFRSAPRFVRNDSRGLVEKAAVRLGVTRIVWFD